MFALAKTYSTLKIIRFKIVEANTGFHITVHAFNHFKNLATLRYILGVKFIVQLTSNN